MDYETLSNCFVAVFEHYKSDEQKVFIVHDIQNDFLEFVSFLQDNVDNTERHISFNGIAFDAQISHYVLDNYMLWTAMSGSQIAGIIYSYAQKCIEKSDAKDFSDYPVFKMSIPQIDIYKLHHWDNPAKRSSLKWIQYSMDWDNILEMPIHHSTNIVSKEEIDTIVEYCINDVKSTKEIFNNSKSEILLRKELSQKYDIDLFSSSEPKISKEIFAYYMSQKMNMTKKEIKALRTYRGKIFLKDIILPYINFKSTEFNKLLDKFTSLELDANNLKGSFKYSMTYKGVKTDFGLGGVHGARNAGVYKSDEDYVIISSDVTSFYPNLAIKNKWAPRHFPKEIFCDQYEWFFDERKKIPKKDPMNYVYKIVLNSTFGLSNDKNSFFYDPQFCMQITVNGQLSLMMLYEMIMENIPNAVAIMQNTDGIETRIPRKYFDKYMEICKEWENITQLSLEHDQYQKLVLADVNNYIGLNNFQEVDLLKWRELRKTYPHYLYKVDDAKFYYAPAKMKGRFDFHNLALHKNKSKLVIPKAIYNYFVHNILPQDYLDENKNIMDYCIGSKSKGDWKQIARYIENGEYKEAELQKVNRYYISRPSKSVKIVKINKTDGREIQLEAGRWMQKLFNKTESKNWEEYDVDTKYYLESIESEINNILTTSMNQLSLF